MFFLLVNCKFLRASFGLCSLFTKFALFYKINKNMSIITMKKKGLCLTLLSISTLQLFADEVVYNGLYYELNDADKTATVVYNDDYEYYYENEDGSALTYDALVIPAKLPEDLQLGGGM